MKGDATHWLTDPEYAALRQLLESANVAARIGRGGAGGGEATGAAVRQAGRVNAPSR